ncbi:MAG: chalcone isomerase family protein [Myxococcota bacterium]|nr:chalcone isomerase family protein [Myxococcota bacterium]
MTDNAAMISKRFVRPALVLSPVACSLLVAPISGATSSEQATGESLARLRSRLDELHAADGPVGSGNHYALADRPDIGTELSKNGRPLAVIPGVDFAAAYFSMWLGERPIDLSLRESLLGSDPTRAQQ